MVDWRVETFCRAQYLNDFSYTWDTDYHRLLLIRDMNSSVRSTDYTDVGIYDCGTSECSSYTETTTTFILSRKSSYREVIDGVCEGGVRLRGQISGNNGTAYLKWYGKAHLITIRESDGSKTTLGEYTTPTEQIGRSFSTGDSETLDIVYPFFIDIDNEVVDENHRFALDVKTYARMWGDGITGYSLRVYHTFNQNDTYVYLMYV